MADMENYKKFWESVTGRPYGTIKPESPKKNTKTTTNGREGVEPRAKEVCAEKV